MSTSEAERRDGLDAALACPRRAGGTGGARAPAPERPADRQDAGDEARPARFIGVHILAALVLAEDLDEVDLVALEPFAEIADVGDCQWRRERHSPHLRAAVLDAACQLDLAFAAQERDARHLVQIAAHRVGRAWQLRHLILLVGLVFREIVVDVRVHDRERQRFRTGRAIDERDVELAEQRHDVVDLGSRDRLGRQQLADLVEGEEPSGLAELNESLDLFELAGLHAHPLAIES